MSSSIVDSREVAFHETDLAGMVHFSNFFRWMESAEHAFLKSIGLAPVIKDGAEFWGWPRVKASCEYKEPLGFGDRFECCLFVKEIKIKSVVYFFRFRKILEDGSRLYVAKGEMTCVYAHFDVANDAMAALNLSDELLNELSEATAEEMRKPG